MWLNTAACDHTVTPSVAVPQSWSHCSHPGHQCQEPPEQGKQGLWDRAPGAALGLCTNTSMAPELSLSLAGAGPCTPCMEHDGNLQKAENALCSPSGIPVGLEGLWGEGGAPGRAPAGTWLQGQSAARLWLRAQAPRRCCSPNYERESRSCSLGWVKPRELLHADCSFLFKFHFIVELF